MSHITGTSNGFCAMTLDPIERGVDDEYNDQEFYRANERFWWHGVIAKEMLRLAAIGIHAQCVSGIAQNLTNGTWSAHDIARYCRQMVGWGELVKAAPLRDFEPDLWVSLAR